MALRFHNQLTHTVDDFLPIHDGEVKLYTCGPTVYSTPTVGNWASYIYWDILVRTLEAQGLAVTRVMNFTDVGHLVSDADDGEDKLEKGARREGKTAWEVADYYIADFMKGMSALNLVPPTYAPRATDYIAQQIALVRTLKEKGYTYQIDDGIYYDTAQFPRYGVFAGLDLTAQKAGARIARNDQKRNPSDFALWKFTPGGTTRDMEWETPSDLLDDAETGRMGFPGWHLECSAMALDLLGETIDIHTGGIDHIPVHHTNEIAQSEGATGKPLAHFWLHSNHLKINGTKISKSLGNGYTLQDIEEKGFSPLDLRMAILQGHYRSEGNFTLETLAGARNRRLHWRSIAALRHQSTEESSIDEALRDTLALAKERLAAALSDDLMTPVGLAVVDEALAEVAAAQPEMIPVDVFSDFLDYADKLLGLRLVETTPDITGAQKATIQERLEARAQKDDARSDELRDIFTSQGIVVKDTTAGSLWEYSA